MAFQITTTITDNDYQILFENTDGVTVCKGAIEKEEVDDVAIACDLVCITTTNRKRPIFKFDWHLITSPVVVSALDLYNQLNVMINNRPGNGQAIVESLTAGVTKTHTFATPFVSTYDIDVYECYDAVGNPAMYVITNRLLTSFDVMTPVNSTFVARAIQR